jgi:serine/threonine-protein kinase
MTHLAPGDILNHRYHLTTRIGGGSMGEVWRGRDLVLGRTVAVKIVLPGLLDAPTFADRFAAEARVMAMIDHPGVVGVFDYGYTPATAGRRATAFLVMEYVEGESLDKVLERCGPLGPGFVLDTVARLLEALSVVHRQGIVHRDVKPSNVLLTNDGVVLADFGIARSPESVSLTGADALMGTVPYLAPELFHAEGASPATDVYAVGVLAYELLSGAPPFDAESTAAVMYKHVNEVPPPLPQHVPGNVAALVARALAKEPRQRWSDAAAMAAAVREVIAAGPGPATGGYGGGCTSVAENGTAFIGAVRMPDGPVVVGPAWDDLALTREEPVVAGSGAHRLPRSEGTRRAAPAGRAWPLRRSAGVPVAVVGAAAAGLTAVLMLNGGGSPAATPAGGLPTGPAGTVPNAVGGVPGPSASGRGRLTQQREPARSGEPVTASAPSGAGTPPGGVAPPTGPGPASSDAGPPSPTSAPAPTTTAPTTAPPTTTPPTTAPPTTTAPTSAASANGSAPH